MLVDVRFIEEDIREPVFLRCGKWRLGLWLLDGGITAAAATATVVLFCRGLS